MRRKFHIPDTSDRKANIGLASAIIAIGLLVAAIIIVIA